MRKLLSFMLGRGTYSHKNNSVRIEKIFSEEQGPALTLPWDNPQCHQPRTDPCNCSLPGLCALHHLKILIPSSQRTRNGLAHKALLSQLSHEDE